MKYDACVNAGDKELLRAELRHTYGAVRIVCPWGTPSVPLRKPESHGGLPIAKVHFLCDLSWFFNCRFQTAAELEPGDLLAPVAEAQGRMRLDAPLAQ